MLCSGTSKDICQAGREGARGREEGKVGGRRAGRSTRRGLGWQEGSRATHSDFCFKRVALASAKSGGRDASLGDATVIRARSVGQARTGGVTVDRAGRVGRGHGRVD